MLELLQKRNKEKIVLCNAGVFYLARGKDAILLNTILDLQLSCMETEICKVGFPIASLEKYTKLIEEKEYSYIVYNFEKNTKELKIIKEYEGKKTNKQLKDRNNCYICKRCTKGYKKEDKYIEAVGKLYEEDNKEKEGRKKDCKYIKQGEKNGKQGN